MLLCISYVHNIPYWDVLVKGCIPVAEDNFSTDFPQNILTATTTNLPLGGDVTDYGMLVAALLQKERKLLTYLALAEQLHGEVREGGLRLHGRSGPFQQR